MFEGSLYGPLLVRDLLKARILIAEEPNAMLQMRLSDRTISIIKGKGRGKLLTSLENLDKIYEIAGGS
jgi:hypothetical protein